MRQMLLFLGMWLCVLSGCRQSDSSRALPQAPKESNRGPAATEGNKATLADSRDAASEQSKNVASPAAKKSVQSRVEQCKAAKENVLRLETEGGAAPQTIVLLQAKSKDFIKQCETYSDALVQCLAEAKTMDALSACRFENTRSIRPDPSLMDLCDAAYKNARLIIAAAGAPGPALSKFDESRPEALIQCTREPKAVVECLSQAKSMAELRACRESVDGSIPAVAKDVEVACRAIHKQVFRSGDVPEFFQKKWKDDVDGFVVECGRMPPEMRACMATADKFSDFQLCAKKNTPKATK